MRGGREGSGEKVWGKEKEEEVANRRSKNRKEKRNEGGGGVAETLFGVIAVRSRFSSFLPVHNLLLLSRFFSFSSPTAVLSTLSSKVQPPPCFSSSACTPTALYACKQPSRVRLKKEEKKEKRRTIMGREGGRNREDKTNDMRIMQSVPYRVTENEARE